jgi:hypothetical protein
MIDPWHRSIDGQMLANKAKGFHPPLSCRTSAPQGEISLYERFRQFSTL